MNSELTDSIKKWLATNGYPLEMKAAKIFKNAGFDIGQSQYYLDQQTDEYRELDVLATSEKSTDSVVYMVRTLIECKFCKPNPWILFTKAGNVKENLPLHMHPGNYFGNLMTHLYKVDKQFIKLPILSEHAVSGYALAESMRNPDKKDNSYASLMGLSKSINAFSKHPTYWHAAGKDICEIFVAVAVIDGSLFRAFLDESDVAQVEQIERGTVVWHNPVCGNTSCVINVVTISALPKFCQELKASSDVLWNKVIEEGMIDKMAKSQAKVPNKRSKTARTPRTSVTRRQPKGEPGNASL